MAKAPSFACVRLIARPVAPCLTVGTDGAG